MRTKRPTPRLDVPAQDKLNQAQRALRDAIASGPRGTFKFTGPFAIWLHAPEIGQDRLRDVLIDRVEEDVRSLRTGCAV